MPHVRRYGQRIRELLEFGWHLNEARRLLADWLGSEALASGCKRVPEKRIYQYGPNCVRDSRDLRAALATLAERGRARMEADGRRRCVAINPALPDGRE